MRRFYNHSSTLSGANHRCAIINLALRPPRGPPKAPRSLTRAKRNGVPKRRRPQRWRSAWARFYQGPLNSTSGGGQRAANHVGSIIISITPRPPPCAPPSCVAVGSRRSVGFASALGGVASASGAGPGLSPGRVLSSLVYNSGIPGLPKGPNWASGAGPGLSPGRVLSSLVYNSGIPGRP